MAKARLVLRSDQRVFFAGKTGSGKSFLARYLLRSMRRLIVIDPKISPSIGKWNLEPYSKDAMDRLEKGEHARIRITNPPAIDKEGFPIWDYFFEFAWDVADICVYIDEMGSVSKNGNMTYALRRLYQQGREHGIGVWAATQRTHKIPLEMFSEAEWGCVFMLKIPEDRDRIAKSTGYAEVLEPVRDEHGFYIFYETWPQALYYQRFDPDDTQFERTEAKIAVPKADTELHGRKVYRAQRITT